MRSIAMNNRKKINLHRTYHGFSFKTSCVWMDWPTFEVKIRSHLSKPRFKRYPFNVTWVIWIGWVVENMHMSFSKRTHLNASSFPQNVGNRDSYACEVLRYRVQRDTKFNAKAYSIPFTIRWSCSTLASITKYC